MTCYHGNEISDEIGCGLYTVFRKNTHSHFLSYLHDGYVDLNKIAVNIPKEW